VIYVSIINYLILIIEFKHDVLRIFPTIHGIYGTVHAQHHGNKEPNAVPLH